MRLQLVRRTEAAGQAAAAGTLPASLALLRQVNPSQASDERVGCVVCSVNDDAFPAATASQNVQPRGARAMRRLCFVVLCLGLPTLSWALRQQHMVRN